MPDHFATLDQPRRPWLEADALKDRFHRLSVELHPDVPGTGDAARFATLNTAYMALRDPAARTRHLLELEAPDRLAAPAPVGELGDLFLRQATIQQKIKTLVGKRRSITSPLAHALIVGEVSGLRKEAEDFEASLDQAQTAALDALRTLDTIWAEASDTRFAELAVLQCRLSFLTKWRAQLREALFQLREGEASAEP